MINREIIHNNKPTYLINKQNYIIFNLLLCKKIKVFNKHYQEMENN